jgi:hypothetical protein
MTPLPWYSGRTSRCSSKTRTKPDGPDRKLLSQAAPAVRGRKEHHLLRADGNHSEKAPIKVPVEYLEDPGLGAAHSGARSLASVSGARIRHASITSSRRRSTSTSARRSITNGMPS